MSRYSNERKETILKKLLPPQNMTVSEVARQEGISSKTLYNWRDNAKKLGLPVPGKTFTSEQWSADTKLAVIVETATMSESELGKYCRAKGLFVEQIKRWKEDCLAGFKTTKEQEKLALKQAKIDKRKIKMLEKDLHRKNAALAETTALLVLRKKLNAFWGKGKKARVNDLDSRTPASCRLIRQAFADGARLEPACAEVCISLRTPIDAGIKRERTTQSAPTHCSKTTFEQAKSRRVSGHHVYLQ